MTNIAEVQFMIILTLGFLTKSRICSGENCCFNSSRIDSYLEYEPHPSSSKNLHHLFQSMCFCSISILLLRDCIFLNKISWVTYSPVERDKMLEDGLALSCWCYDGYNADEWACTIHAYLFVRHFYSLIILPLMFLVIVHGSDPWGNIRDVWLWSVEKSNILQTEEATSIWCQLHPQFIADLDGLRRQWCISRRCRCAAYDQGIGIKAWIALSWKLRTHRFPIKHERQGRCLRQYAFFL